MLGGVCAGLAKHLDSSVKEIRILMLIGGALGGFGVIVYVWLWALAPVAGGRPPAAPVAGGGYLRGGCLGVCLRAAAHRRWLPSKRPHGPGRVRS